MPNLLYNSAMLTFNLLLCCAVCLWQAELSQATPSADADKIQNLPGLTFNPGFDQYSGYLQPSPTHFHHYWLVESQHNQATDPIVLWLNGGPGCSSLGGFMEELGPFHPNRDGQTLWENEFAWNKRANVLFMESPAAVGFSYVTDGNTNTSDEQTAWDNYHALVDFFDNKFPEYQSHDFYITGESYCGVYIPMLAALVVDGMKNGTFHGKLKGFAIGNGILSEQLQHNSVINYMYYHGLIDVELFGKLNTACCNDANACNCDWYSSLKQLNNDWRSTGTLCGNLTWQISENMLWNNALQDEYNIYQDCYNSTKAGLSSRGTKLNRLRTSYRAAFPTFFQSGNNVNEINSDSTDALNGFPCWDDQAVQMYLNTPAVKDALHVAPSAYHNNWTDCNGNFSYNRQYYDMDPFFKHILTTNSDVRILIYNGDVDMVCNFLGDEWFIHRVASNNSLSVTVPRYQWLYRDQIGGYAKHFQRIDLVTVKGAGHFVPTDRAGPALQMIMNFIWNKGNYSLPTGIDTTPKALITTPKPLSTATAPTVISTPSSGSINGVNMYILFLVLALAYIQSF